MFGRIGQKKPPIEHSLVDAKKAATLLVDAKKAATLEEKENTNNATTAGETIFFDDCSPKSGNALLPIRADQFTGKQDAVFASVEDPAVKKGPTKRR